MKNYLCSQKEFGGNYRDRTKTDASTDAGVDPVKSSAITSPSLPPISKMMGATNLCGNRSPAFPGPD